MPYEITLTAPDTSVSPIGAPTPVSVRVMPTTVRIKLNVPTAIDATSRKLSISFIQFHASVAACVSNPTHTPIVSLDGRRGGMDGGVIHLPVLFCHEYPNASVRVTGLFPQYAYELLPITPCPVESSTSAEINLQVSGL